MFLREGPAAVSLRNPPASIGAASVTITGKSFWLGAEKWHLKGLTYGPFGLNSNNEFLPEQPRLLADFAQIREVGANCIRLYHVPTPALLDAALDNGLRVFVDVPWEKHRCFFEDWAAMHEARERVRTAARDLGKHAALFAISVANEIPSDIVRFYGHRRVGRFVEELIDAVKQESPDCLTTFANYPSTEFLQPDAGDFVCFNIYLEDGEALGAYLDRLQHLAASKPLILGELGIDSIRGGEDRQAKLLADQVSRAFHHGLSGSFVFSFSDDWLSGGHRIDDWAFGVTRTDRSEKPAAAALRETWRNAPRGEPSSMPRVSVVVCSYNGAATLRECLESLVRLDYPDYEIILVDDGSRDQTPAIAADFPSVRLIRQENLGLSVARNVGARAASGAIIAYTDSDCIADPDWLYGLVDAMGRQGVEAIGGPNLPPVTDCWTAQCVAASPGGPSHVMLNDTSAEHVPGCNMAFDRGKLLAIGGFDSTFRVAGDDVDICWRFLDAGWRIGYAPSALVWHRRRSTVGGYLRQQQGYGRSEAALRFKHPFRFNAAGLARWRGVIYGDGVIGLPATPPRTCFGRFGTGLFQIVYQSGEYSHWAYYTLMEWQALAIALVAASLLWKPLALAGGTMVLMSWLAALRAALAAPLPAGAPAWCRPMVFLLHLLQPIARTWPRYRERMACKRLPRLLPSPMPGQRISFNRRDLNWRSRDGRGRLELLDALVDGAHAAGWRGVFGAEWERWDALLFGGVWFDIIVRTATEQLGGAKRFTRVRFGLRTTRLARCAAAAVGVACGASLIFGHHWLIAASVALAAGLCGALLFGRATCLRSAAALVWDAGNRAGLEPVTAAPKPVRQTSPANLDEPEPVEAYAGG